MRQMSIPTQVERWQAPAWTSAQPGQKRQRPSWEGRWRWRV